MVGETEAENDILDPYTHRSDIEELSPLRKLIKESEEQEETVGILETDIAQEKEASGLETVEKEFSISDVSNHKEKQARQLPKT